MRLISTVESDAMPHLGVIIGKLHEKMTLIAHNPSNPNFTHFLFESLAALIKVTCAADPTAVKKFEDFLFPIFVQILKEDMQGTCFLSVCLSVQLLICCCYCVSVCACMCACRDGHYVLQIFSQLLEFNNPATVNRATPRSLLHISAYFVGRWEYSWSCAIDAGVSAAAGCACRCCHISLSAIH